MKDILAKTDHRPWPMPEQRWTMRQDWCDLLFAHWPVPAEALRPLIPQGLELDLFDGDAWLGVVPFRMANVRLRGTPNLPGISAFPELNVRTYVRYGDRAGVWFFSLDASRLAIVLAARSWYGLPYYHARMSCVERDGEIEYLSERRDGTASYKARYRPTGDVALAVPGSLEHWLTERYCLYALNRRGVLTRADVHHEPWPLQTAEAEIETDTYPRAAGLDVPSKTPLLHFAREIKVVVWSPRPIEERS